MNTFLFDLDGTLLPLDEEAFIDIYMNGLAGGIIKAGYSEKAFTKALWAGIEAMRNNSGLKTNEQMFWSVFSDVFSYEANNIEDIFMQYYLNGYADTRASASPTPHAAYCVQTLREKGYRVALATNPLFPSVATFQRIKWAGLNPDDFLLVTTIENSYYCKPNLRYYEHILRFIDAVPADCIMVGNDVQEDMIAAKLGMDVFLMRDCLINKSEEDIRHLKQGNFNDLVKYINSLPNIK